MVGFLRDALSDHLRFGWFEFHERTAPAASRRALHTNWLGNCGMIRAGERGTVYPYMGVSVAVDGPDDGTIRIPMPSCRPWRGERARRKWIRETEDLICTQLDD